MQAYLYHARERRRGDSETEIEFIYDFVVSALAADSYTVSCSSLEATGQIWLAVRNTPWVESEQEKRLLIIGQTDDGTVFHRDNKPNEISNSFTASVTEGAVPHYCAFVRTVEL